MAIVSSKRVIPGGRKALMDIVIPAGATGLSSVINLGDWIVAGVSIPSDWTTASMTFVNSFDETGDEAGTYQDVKSESNAEYTVSTIASKFHKIPLADSIGWGQFIKLRSGTSGSAVNQTNAPTVVLSLIR